MVEGIFDGTFKTLERSLDIRMMRQQLLSSNVANLDTPGYRALDIDFRESIRRAMEAEDREALEERWIEAVERGFRAQDRPEARLEIVGVDGLMVGPDSNSANLELLMGRLHENALLYRVATDMIGRRFQGLRSAIEGAARV